MEDEHAFSPGSDEEYAGASTKCTYLFLLDEPIIYHQNDEWVCPHDLRLAAYYRDEETAAFHLYDRQPVTDQNGICQLMSDHERHQFMIFLLFSGEKQYGLLACDIQQEEFPFFYVISLQIGLSLHYLEISKSRSSTPTGNVQKSGART